MCPPQTAFVGFKIRVPVCRENFHRQIVCLSHGTDRNVTIKERLDVFSRLPVFAWISIKRCERSHFPPSLLLLHQAVTNRQIRAVCAQWRRLQKRDDGRPLDLHAIRTNVICRLYGCRTEKQMWECRGELRTDAGPLRKHKPPQKDKGRRCFQRIDRDPNWWELSSSSCCHRFYALLYAPPSSTICFLGNQSSSTATSTYTYNPLQSKALNIILELVHLLKELDVWKYETQMFLVRDDESNISVCVILQVFLLLPLLHYNWQHY